MQTWHLPPMAGGSDDHHHREVICIEARRIGDFCFQEHHLERTFQASAQAGANVMCEIIEADITCRVVERRSVDRHHIKNKERELVCVAVTVPVTLTITDMAGNVVQTLDETVTFLKQAVLCMPDGTTVDCDVTGDCCCFIDRMTGLVSCTFDFWAVKIPDHDSADALACGG